MRRGEREAVDRRNTYNSWIASAMSTTLNTSLCRTPLRYQLSQKLRNADESICRGEIHRRRRRRWWGEGGEIKSKGLKSEQLRFGRNLAGAERQKENWSCGIT
jgi:hypothetical protein